MDPSKRHLDEEEKNALVCGICFELYDTGVRTPKFLQCHHTCCLSCLKSLLKYQRLDCPFCRSSTAVSDINQLVTNFYILPTVLRVDVYRRRLEYLRQKSKGNWEKSKSMRKKIVAKLKAADDACRLLKSKLLKMCEENSEKIDTLKAIIEAPTEDLVEEVLSMKTSHSEMDFEESENSFADSENLKNAFEDVEKYSYSLILQDHEGQKFILDSMYNKPITFELTDDQHKSHADAIQPLLSYIVFLMKDIGFLRPLEKENPPRIRRARSTSGSWNVHFKS